MWIQLEAREAIFAYLYCSAKHVSLLDPTARSGAPPRAPFVYKQYYSCRISCTFGTNPTARSVSTAPPRAPSVYRQYYSCRISCTFGTNPRSVSTARSVSTGKCENKKKIPQHVYLRVLRDNTGSYLSSHKIDNQLQQNRKTIENLFKAHPPVPMIEIPIL